MMCRSIEEANLKLFYQKVPASHITIGSMDAVALFPSLKLEGSLKIVKCMIQESKVDFTDVSWTELAKYLKVVCTPTELVNHLPIRYSNRGTKPTIRYLLTDTIKSKKVSLTQTAMTDQTEDDIVNSEDDLSDSEDDDTQLEKRRQLFGPPSSNQVLASSPIRSGANPLWPVSPVTDPTSPPFRKQSGEQSQEGI